VEPDVNSKIVTTIKKNDVYTIIEEKNNWGKLKSGIGWISLKYTSKI
jgi:N-acetylmuramoyl-L-alanine amidase